MFEKAKNISYKKVNAHIQWNELFKKEMSPSERRQRWDEWKAATIAEGEPGKEIVDYWAKDHIEEGCAGCIHRDNDWCKSNDLPCNVNPVLTIEHGIIGMACMGAGYAKK